MIKYMTPEEQSKFWQRHQESKDAMTERWWNLPYWKKVEILEKRCLAGEAVRNAKRIAHSK